MSKSCVIIYDKLKSYLRKMYVPSLFDLSKQEVIKNYPKYNLDVLPKDIAIDIRKELYQSSLQLYSSPNEGRGHWKILDIDVYYIINEKYKLEPHIRIELYLSGVSYVDHIYKISREYLPNEELKKIDIMTLPDNIFDLLYQFLIERPGENLDQWLIPNSKTQEIYGIIPEVYFDEKNNLLYFKFKNFPFIIEYNLYNNKVSKTNIHSSNKIPFDDYIDDLIYDNVRGEIVIPYLGSIYPQKRYFIWGGTYHVIYKNKYLYEYNNGTETWNKDNNHIENINVLGLPISRKNIMLEVLF